MNHKVEPIIFDKTLTTHPFFGYAEEAFSIIDHRFPDGAGEKNNDMMMTSCSSEYRSALIKKLDAFYEFSTTDTPTTNHFVTLITGLTSGNADILTGYALGHLRTTFSIVKPYFSMVAIQQTVEAPAPFLLSHCLLLISDTPISNEHKLIRNNRALLCDLWSREIFLATSLPQRQARHSIVTITTRCQNPFDRRQKSTSFCDCDYLNGTIKLMPTAAWNDLYIKFEAMVALSPPLPIEEVPETSEEPTSSPIASKPPTPSAAAQGVFTHKRSVWEQNNPIMIGYFCDEHGNYYPIRRVNRNTQFGYWNPTTDHMQRLQGITKNAHGAYYYNDTKLLQHLPRASEKSQSAATASLAAEEHCVVPGSTL